MNIKYDVIILILKYIFLRRSRVAIFADIMLTCLLKQSLKTQKR